MFRSGPSPPLNRPRLSLPCVALALSCLGAVPGSAQVIAFDCLPPALPYAAPPEALVGAYRAELRSDYAAWFDAAQRYLRCLAQAEATAHAEIEAGLEAYRRLFESGAE